MSSLQLRGQSAGSATLVKAARLLDPRTGRMLAPAAVVIEGEKITQVGLAAHVTAPMGARVIDLGAATLLPGLIDGHTHLFLDLVAPLLVVALAACAIPARRATRIDPTIALRHEG